MNLLNLPKSLLTLKGQSFISKSLVRSCSKGCCKSGRRCSSTRIWSPWQFTQTPLENALQWYGKSSLNQLYIHHITKKSASVYRYWNVYCDLEQSHVNLDTIVYDQRKFRNLTSDYTESCRWRSVNQEMWSRRCDTAEMWDMRIWRVGSARNAVFFHSFVASQVRKVRS